MTRTDFWKLAKLKFVLKCHNLLMRHIVYLTSVITVVVCGNLLLILLIQLCLMMEFDHLSCILCDI